VRRLRGQQLLQRSSKQNVATTSPARQAMRIIQFKQFCACKFGFDAAQHPLLERKSSGYALRKRF